jgi:hypothetical protein
MKPTTPRTVFSSGPNRLAATLSFAGKVISTEIEQF